MIGESIAHYSITAKIGAGGMGEVWRARDTKLNRDVALKIIPDLFAQDAERMARFSREAQLLASLNHANIAAIYGVEEAGGRRALVLEMVEGEDLRERLLKGALPQEEALEIARQIAEALEAAHEKGVVHRDLKPANVKLTPDGTVKVLDFGLAKALEGDPAAIASDPSQSLSPTLTVAATRAGIILGTAAYMSPEQAKGKVVDRRADIWSFGVVLFEMLAGGPTFSGESVSETLASVIKEEPDWSRIPRETPEAVVQLLRRCLEKDPKQRLQSIGEARIALRNTMMGTVAGGSAMALESAAEQKATPQRRRLSAGPGLIGVILITAALAGAAGWYFKPAGDGVPPRRYTITAPELRPGYRNQPAISPDGRRVAYIAENQLWVRDLDKLEPHLIQDSAGARAISWSPDSESLIFVADDQLRRVAAAGGPPSVLTEVRIGRVDATAWSEDGSIYVAPGQGPMYRVPEQGGDPQVAIPLKDEGETDFHTPSALPGGRGLLYSVHRGGGADTIEALRDGERKVILQIEGDRIESASFASEGYLIFARESKNVGVWAAPFSVESLEITGDPFLLDPDGIYPSIARDGTLLYSIGAGAALRQLVWIGRDGKVIGTIGQPGEGSMFPEISPDGGRVLISENAGDNRDIWIVDVERGTRTRATFGEEQDWSGAWYPDGTRFFFSHGLGSTNQTFSRAADGTDEPVKMGDFYLPSFRAASDMGIATLVRPETERDLVIVSLADPDSEPRPFLVAPTAQTDAQLSPDGKHVAYISDESGDREVYIKKFPGGEGKWQVSVDGGTYPRWSPDGRELYYEKRGATSTLMVVKVTSEPSLRLSTPEVLFDESSGSNLTIGTGPRNYDVHPDGQRFVAIQRAGQDDEVEPRLAVTQNWLGVWGK